MADRSVTVIAATKEAAHEAFGRVAQALALTNETDIRIAVTGPPIPPPDLDRRHVLFYASDCLPPSDLVIVSDSVRFYDTLWGEAFLALAARLVMPAGRLILPAGRHGHNGSVFMRPDRVGAMLGSRADRIDGIDYLSVPIEAPHEREPPAGSLSWFMSQKGGSVLLDLATRDASASQAAAMIGQQSASVIEFGRPRAGTPAPGAVGARSAYRSEATASDLVANAWATAAYAIGGTSYKSAAVLRILSLCGEAARLRRLLDLGGMFGALAVDLVLDPRSPVEAATTVDILPGNAVVAAQLLADLQPQLAGRCRHVVASIPDYLPPGPIDVATALGSLLYVPRDELKPALTRLWSSLRPGGVMIVHENIRRPGMAQHRDLAAMFDEAELSTTLSGFGTVRFLHPTVLRELDLSNAAGKNCFRFIQKA